MCVVGAVGAGGAQITGAPTAGSSGSLGDRAAAGIEQTTSGRNLSRAEHGGGGVGGLSSSSSSKTSSSSGSAVTASLAEDQHGIIAHGEDPGTIIQRQVSGQEGGFSGAGHSSSSYSRREGEGGNPPLPHSQHEVDST